MANQPKAWFNRAKPRYADAFRIFDKARYVFIGYPLLRKGAKYDPQALRSCLVDPTCPRDEWERYKPEGRKGAMFTRNRKFVPRVTKKSIVVIPLPKEGAVYVARINGPFEIVDSPAWAEDYLKLRECQGLDHRDDEKHPYIADVAQGWPVDEYKRFPLSFVPGWMRQSMFGRSTFGDFWCHHPTDKNTTAWDVLNTILEEQHTVSMLWTLDLEEIKRRLVNTMTANAFEHLVVSALQLTHPDQIWYQTGGPGDGGIDGMGIDEESGEVVGLMQAKLVCRSSLNLANLGHQKQMIRRYAAVLIQEKPEIPVDGTELLDLEWIARAVRCHWQDLPQARAMRVGKPSIKMKRRA